MLQCCYMSLSLRRLAPVHTTRNRFRNNHHGPNPFEYHLHNILNNEIIGRFSDLKRVLLVFDDYINIKQIYCLYI